MVHRSDKEDAVEQFSAEDDLGRLIRWGLEDSYSQAEPPADLWPKILARVQEMPAPTPSTRPARGRRRPALSLAPFVQAVVVSALLLAFMLGVDRNVVAPRVEQRVRPTPTVQRVAVDQEFPDDMLRGYMLARVERAPLVHYRQGGAHP